MWEVKIIDAETEEVVKRIKCSSESKADRVAAGVSINLNHDKYFVDATEVEKQ